MLVRKYYSLWKKKVHLNLNNFDNLLVNRLNDSDITLRMTLDKWHNKNICLRKKISYADVKCIQELIKVIFFNIDNDK